MLLTKLYTVSEMSFFKIYPGSKMTTIIKFSCDFSESKDSPLDTIFTDFLGLYKTSVRYRYS